MSVSPVVLDFTDKVAIVTGGARGIGRAVAEGMIAGGGKVVIADLDLDTATQTAQELGENAVAVKIDLGDTASISGIIENIKKQMGRIDILVNNAGMISTKSFDDLTLEEWERVVRINLNGTFATTHSVYPMMKEQGYGRIVNVSSVAAKLGGGLLGTAAYASSKAGINGLTKAVAREGAPYGVYCNAVCPSFTETAMTTELSENKDRNEAVLSGIPLGRAAQPKEIANMILFFASDLASFITGEIGDVDGGITRDG